MGTVKTIERISDKISQHIRRNLVYYTEIKTIEKKRNLYESVILDTIQNNEIQSFYKKYYGKKISTKWHRLYTSYTGTFCYDYFPEILLSTRLEPLMNPYRDAELLGDKNLIPILFKDLGLHIPLTFVSNVRGIFRDSDNKIITAKKALKIIKQLEVCVIKKTVDTDSGRDVAIVYPAEEDIETLIKQFNKNFVVQERIIQSDELSKLNPSSINTFRVMTYILNDDIHVCPIALRIGRSNADRDNIHYGGIAVGLHHNGTLRDTAFTEYGERFKAHPDTHIIFENYMIPNSFNILHDTGIKLHSRIPYLKLLSWDITLDSNNVPTLIEMNTMGQAAWLCQMVNGKPLFANNTSDILRIIKQ